MRLSKERNLMKHLNLKKMIICLMGMMRMIQEKIPLTKSLLVTTNK